MWDLIVSVPDHCLSFYFTRTLIDVGSSPCLQNTDVVISRGRRNVNPDTG